MTKKQEMSLEVFIPSCVARRIICERWVCVCEKPLHLSCCFEQDIRRSAKLYYSSMEIPEPFKGRRTFVDFLSR